ncbi:MAG: hypothetical protein KDJ41_11425 [Hyphomicrobiaceae bacterium]|nr:hypothetical protein [Hyphomicrobiaceae bacterium]
MQADVRIERIPADPSPTGTLACDRLRGNARAEPRRRSRVKASAYDDPMSGGMGASVPREPGSTLPTSSQTERDRVMEPKVIVMIVTLALPSGDKGVHVTPFPDVERCVVAANLEATDPKVLHVECSELANGELKLQFKRSWPS